MRKAKSMADRVEAFSKETTDSQNKTTMLNTRVPKRLVKALKVYVVLHDTSVQKFITEMIEKELKDRGAL